ncbi:cytochrome P450 [uncultured Kriegella sp.]|uniref:cytochrome P450 n=1 Tax=uncultured Kriegella sp. TaxID=1798910 RepID=UPI0030DAD01D|tara:strand:- start:65010 stop:66347 length:1338 start_codon:yes stop_codon:yes gene_type:complete
MQHKIPVVSLPQFLLHSLDILKNPLPFHHSNFQKHGDVFRLKIGFKNSVIFSRDAALAEYVLQKNWKNYTKSSIQTVDLAKYLGKGLLTSEGEHWRKQRKLIQPAFHKKQLARLLASIQETIIDALNQVNTGMSTDVFPIFNDLAFKTVVRSLFSNAVSDQEIAQLQHSTEMNQKMLVKELRQPYLGWYFRASGKIDEHIKLAETSKSILLGIISRRKASGQRYDDLLDMLLEARYDDGTAMSEEQLIDEILVLFVAGHETTANTLSFTVQLLAQHPKWQKQIMNEFRKVGNADQDLIQVVMSSPIVTQVIEESMRLYPPAYFMDRVNLEEDSFNGFIFEKDSSLLFSIYEIHRHPELWETPEKFMPERFQFDKARNYSSFYFPFGAGPRKCIGNNFAMFEMIMTVIQLVKRFEIIPVKDEIEINPLITLKPKNALVAFKKRNLT